MPLVQTCLAVIAAALVLAAGASAQTFSYTGAEQTYTVPAGASAIHVVAVGGTGVGDANAGRGGVVTADLPATAGSALYVEVGGNGRQCVFTCPPPAFNGGNISGGAGASDVRTVSCVAACPGPTGSLASRLIVAGGGGSANYEGATGGDAGQPGTGGDLAGAPGTQTGGGAGGVVHSSQCDLEGVSGTLGQGGEGWELGGGGGGYYGGGGGATEIALSSGNPCGGFPFTPLAGGGGAGGSDFVEPGAQSVSFGVDSSDTPSVTVTVQPVATNVPRISGTAVQRQSLSDVHGVWTGNVTGFAYQWERCDSGGATCAPIGGATSQTYVSKTADVGYTLRVQEAASNPDGNVGIATSAPTQVVQAVAPSPAPSIFGAAVQGQVIGDVHGNWPGGPSGFSYQWLRCSTSGGGCVAIGGATNQAYALNAADVGSTIRVLESVAYADGNTASITSAPTAVVAAVAPPLAVIVGPGSALVGQAQTYHASITDSEGVPNQVNWTVGGHSVASGPSARIAFAHPGTGLILLQVTDTSGNSFAATRSVHVSFPRLSIRVTWSANNSIPPSFSSFTSLVAHAVPTGARITVTCDGDGCPFGRRSVAVASSTNCHSTHCGKRRPGPSARDVDLTSLLARHRLSIGTTLTIRFTEKSFVGEVQTFHIGASGPLRVQQCLAPGSTKPGHRC
jgi:hypothetical protein